MCGLLIKEEDEKELVRLKVKDSKLLTKNQREFLFDKIKNVSKKHKIIVISPQEIDRAVHYHDGLNLNKLEARKSAEILNELNPNKAIIDAPSNNIKSYKKYLSKPNWEVFIITLVGKLNFVFLFLHCKFECKRI